MRNRKKLRRLFESLGLGALAFDAPAAARFNAPGAGGGTAAADAESGTGEENEGGESGGEGEENEGGDEVIPKSKYDAVLKESMQRKEELRKLNAKIKDLEQRAVSAEDQEELRKLREERQRAEEENKKKRGEFESLTQKMKQEHEAATVKLTQERDGWKTRYEQERVRNALAVAIPKFTTAGTDDLLELLQKKVSVDPESSELVIEGEPTNPKTGKAFTLEEWVEAEVERRPHFAAHKPSGGSGGSSQRGAGGKKGKELTPEEINNLSHDDYIKWEKENLRR